MADSKGHPSPHFTFIWTLENVTERSYLGLTSPSFVVDTIDKSEWCLVLWEREDKVLCAPCKNHDDDLCLRCRNRDDSGHENTELEYETAVITANGSIINAKRQKKCFASDYVFNVRGSSGVGENILLEDKDKPNFKGLLTIRCRMWKPRNESSDSDFCFAHTRLKQERRYFTWMIPGFSSLKEGHMRNFHLQVTPKGDLLPVLHLYLQCDGGEDKVCIEKPKKFPYEIFCKVSVVSATGNVVCSKSISDKAALIKISKLISNKSLYLPNDVLYLRCDCEIDFGVVSHEIENYGQFPMIECNCANCVVGTVAMNHDWSEKGSCCSCCCPLKKVVKKYYENGELTDINLRAGNETFPAHKIILSAKSKVFEEMFSKDKSKNRRKVIELNEFDPDTLRYLLLYMYSEKVEDISPESAMKLYKASIKYEIKDLRKKCSKFLKSNFCMANIFAILVLAEKHQDEDLKYSACSFIFSCDIDVFSLVEWKHFKKRNPMLAMDVMQYVFTIRRFLSSKMKELGQQLEG